MRVVLLQCKDDVHAEKLLKDTDYQLLFYYDRKKEQDFGTGSEQALSAMLAQRTHDRQVIWVTDIELPTAINEGKAA